MRNQLSKQLIERLIDQLIKPEETWLTISLTSLSIIVTQLVNELIDQLVHSHINGDWQSIILVWFQL